MVNREGDTPTAALADLVASAGAHARIVDGTLPRVPRRGSEELGESGSLVAPEWDTEMELPGNAKRGAVGGHAFRMGDRSAR